MGNTCCMNCKMRKENNGETGPASDGGGFTSTDRGHLPPPLPSRPTQPSERIVVAVTDFRAQEGTDVSFVKGDRMVLLDTSGGDWWRIKHLRTGKAGLVPHNHVAEEVSVESEDWFFVNTSRKESEALLLLEENPRGTFLVRKSEHNHDGYSLSIKDWEESKGYHVKHYKIKALEDGGYYIATSHTFPTLQSLVASYHDHDYGLCYTLFQPCPKPKPQMWDLSSEHQGRWEIDRSELELIREVGRGNFGVVWYGTWKNTTEVAVKQLKEDSMSTEAFLEEAAIMKKFRHYHLVALYAVCTQGGPIYIVQEFMCNGSLLDYLRNGDGRYLQVEDLVYVAAQVASGMAYLEGMQLIHRDLAARNVLIGENILAKICDFGLARVIEDDEYCPKQGTRFPVKWTAPEAILHRRFTIKSDVWSFGILLMELFTYGQVPYPGMSNAEVADQVEKGYRMQKPIAHSLPDAIYQTMTQCWDADPQRRPTFEYLYQFFEDFSTFSERPYRDVNDRI